MFKVIGATHSCWIRKRSSRLEIAYSRWISCLASLNTSEYFGVRRISRPVLGQTSTSWQKLVAWGRANNWNKWFKLKITLLRNPTGRRQTNWQLQSWPRIWARGYRETNPSSAQSWTGTRDGWIASPNRWPFGRAASLEWWSSTVDNQAITARLDSTIVSAVPGRSSVSCEQRDKLQRNREMA